MAEAQETVSNWIGKRAGGCLGVAFTDQGGTL
jgi:hypothetical protein